jgi:MFS family permease
VIEKLYDQYPSLRSRPYRALLIGGFVSSIGDYMSVVAVSLYLYGLTHSVFSLSLAWFVRIGVRLVAQLHAGALVDRWNNRTVMAICIVVEMAAAAGMLIATWTSWSVVIAMLAVLQFCSVFYGPAWATAQAKILDKEQLGSAPALNGLVFGVSGLMGPALASVAYAAEGPRWVFAINLISYAAILIPVARLRSMPASPQNELESTWRLVVEGLRQSMTSRFIFSILIATACLSSFIRILDIMLVPMSLRLHSGYASYGVLLSVLTAGGLIGSLLAPRAVPMPKWNRRLPLALAPAAGCFVVLAGWFTGPVIVLATFLTGVGMDVFMAISISVLSTQIPAAIRGRVFAVRNFALALGALPGVLSPDLLMRMGGFRGTAVILACVALAASSALFMLGYGRSSRSAERVAPVPAP